MRSKSLHRLRYLIQHHIRSRFHSHVLRNNRTSSHEQPERTNSRAPLEPSCFSFLYPLLLPVYLAWNTLPVKAYRRTYLLKKGLSCLVSSSPIFYHGNVCPFLAVHDHLFVLEVVV